MWRAGAATEGTSSPVLRVQVLHFGLEVSNLKLSSLGGSL